MDTQKIKQIVEVLQDHNNWRRGISKKEVNGTLVGKTIDSVIEILETEFLTKEKK